MKTMDIVCGILHDEDGYLIARRKSVIHNNVWEFPGGKVEPFETKEEAIVRELKEELNWDCQVDAYLCTICDERSDLTLNVHAFLCHKVSGELKLNAHHEVRRVASDELFDYAFEKADTPLLEALIAYEKRGLKKEN